MLTRRGVLQGLAAEPAGAAWTRGPQLIRIAHPSSVLVAYLAPEQGGELAGLQLLRPGPPRELLYRGRDYSRQPGWSGKAPILWPATGRNLATGEVRQGNGDLGSWRVDGELRPMPIHGFARDLPWAVEAARPDRVRLVLRDGPQTRASFPFGFRLETTYGVEPAGLLIRQRVGAAPQNRRPMPFSIGNHITFAVPLVPGGAAARVVVRTPAMRRVMLDAAGYPTGEVASVPFPTTPLGALPPRTAIALSGYRPLTAWASLEDPAGLTVRISHRADRWPAGDPVLFNLWGDPAAGFFSPEPWVGKQNSLASGDGAIQLNPGEVWTWEIRVAVRAQRPRQRCI